MLALIQPKPEEAVSLLIPMEKLFEEFIAEVLQADPRYFFGVDVPVQSQHYVGKLARDAGTNRDLFGLRPDITIGAPRIRAIIDTKYKELDPEDRRLGVSQSDVYQMYAYATKTYTEKCMLLYPEVLLGQEKNLLLSVPSPESMNRDVLLMIRAVRLSHDLNKKESWTAFRNELRGIVRPLIAEEMRSNLNVVPVALAS